MINLIFLFFSLSGFSCLGALFKKKYEEIMPITVVGIMLFLYLFYIMNILNIGLIFLLVLIIFSYLFFLNKVLKMNSKEKKETLSYIFTPGFVIYLLGFLVVFILTYSNKVLLHDELRLWGAYPKILYYDGSLQLGDSSYLLPGMRSYNPGMPLFVYFVLKVMGTFKENILFFAYALVGFSILIPICKNINWKDWLKIPFYLLALIFIPLLFANSNNDSLVYYYTLYIEPALGIIFGYSIYLTFDSILKDKFKYLLLLVMISGIVLFKDTGILFSVIVGLSFVLSEIFNYKNYKKEKYGIMKLVLVFIIPLLIFCSWKVVQSLYKSENMYTSVLDKSEIVSLFFNPTISQKQLLNSAKNEILFTPIVRSNFSSLDRFYTFPVLFICLLIFFIIYIFICGKKDIKKNSIPIICFVIGSIVFFLGTLFVYFFSIRIVASFPRYISLIFTAGSVLLILLLCDKYNFMNKRIKNKKFFNYFIYTLLVFSLLVLPLKQPKIEFDYLISDINSICETYSNTISSKIDKNQDILLLFSEDLKDNFGYVIYHHQIYLDLLDEGYYSFDCDFFGETVDMNRYKDYDYIYFISTEEDDELSFEAITGYEIDGSTLFEITNSDDIIKLSKVI